MPVHAAVVVTSAVVGLSRVLLGAHWFSDVAFGWAAGATWATTVTTADRIVQGGRRRRALRGF